VDARRVTPAAVSAADAMLGGVENRTAVSPVFVGRRQELAGLTDALDRADDGAPQALLVGGEAGVGKTRLLEEFLAAARRRGAVTAVGGCLELGADGLPFAPFATALRSLHRTLGDAELAAAVAGHEAELARLLPDLKAAHPGDADRTPAGESENGRARLFELTALLLERLAAERTVVLALEDLHWADRSTRELLGYLFRSLQGARLVLVATYRADDIHRRHPLRPFLAETDRLRTVRRVELPRLTRAEVRAQIAGIQGVSDPEAELVETVFERTDGNPFFVEELTENCATCGISDSLRDLLLVRVEALPESAQQVVRLAAQGGSAVEHALLAAVCPLPETDLLDALRAAVGANVLLPTEDGEGYRFRHALLREAVDDDLLPGEGARLSRRYAQALEADPGLVRRPEVRATRLAHYWYRGRDAAKALPAVLAASVEARSRHAFAEQHQLLERALGLWDQAPQDVRAALRPVDHADAYPACAADTVDAADDSLRFMDLLAETVVAARTGGELDRALVLARRALELLDERADPQRAAWFRGQAAILLEDLGRSGGLRELERAQQVLRGLPPTPVQAQILSLQAGWSMLYHPGPEALATAERAVELARLTGARTAELRSRVVLGVLILESGNTERGLEEMARARDQALSLGEFGAALNAEVNMAGELAAVGRVTDALTVAENAARTALEHGRADLCAYALADQAWVWLSLGDWTRADQLITEARTHVRAADARACLEILTATLALQRGDSDGLETALKTAYDLVGGHPAQPKQPQQAIPLHWLATALHAERGEVAAARAEVDRALDEGFPPGQHRNAWPLLLTAAAHEARVRGLPSADAGRARILSRLTESARGLPRPAPLWEAHSLLLHAQLARAGGADDPAAWAEAVAVLESLEHPYLLAQARAGRAEALLGASGAGRADARREVAELLGKAHTAADRLGARPLVAEVAQLAARAGVTLGDAGDRAAEQSAAPDPAESFGLTPRERAVLELVAAGRSNRQIAQSLYISPKTASVHVSNILAKLGAAGRTEAAAMAHRLRLVAPAGVPAGG
jgi:DNA-binding CsgD family transcriptional regulator